MSDRERFSLMFEAHHGALEAYVRRRVLPSSVSDIVSEIFLAAWHKLDQIDGQPLPWLYRAAAISAFVALSRQAVQPALPASSGP